MKPGTFESRSSAPARSVAGRLGAIFGVLGGLFVVVTSLVVVNLDQVRQDARRFMEESREARLAQDLMTTVESLRILDTIPDSARPDDLVDAVLSHARERLAELGHGPAGRLDPSNEAHQAAEESIVGTVSRQLDRFESLRGDADTAALSLGAIEAASAEAARIRDETAREADEVSEDLERRVRGLIWVMLFTAIGTCTVLGLLMLMVFRLVVRPVRVLHRGTGLFAAGRLDHRIDLRTDDEFGRLAEEFNRMAEALDRSHRDLEERVRDRTREFIRAARLADLGTFAAGVAHEVNTPLASIASCAEGLQRRLGEGSVDRDEQVDYLSTIAREAYRAHEITARLLAFSREDPGPVSPLPIDEPIQDVVRLLRHRAEARGVRIEVDCEGRVATVRANAGEIQQVLLNLLKNALDATPDGGEVRLRCRNTIEGPVIEVEDEGPGVPADHRARIFDPFFTTKAPGEGTGLGLSLVHRIVEDYGGSIEVENVDRGGARFRVRLPAAREAQGERS